MIVNPECLFSGRGFEEVRLMHYHEKVVSPSRDEGEEFRS